jgi:hypothetical protein
MSDDFLQHINENGFSCAHRTDKAQGGLWLLACFLKEMRSPAADIIENFFVVIADDLFKEREPFLKEDAGIFIFTSFYIRALIPKAAPYIKEMHAARVPFAQGRAPVIER